MIFNTQKTHLIPTLLLLAAAVVPLSPLATLGAYGDTESSTENIFQAGTWGEEVVPFFSLMLDEPQEAVIESGEVAGTSTEPVVEVGEPVVETTIDEEEETPAEEPAPLEPVVEVSEPIVEITTPEPAPEPEPATDPQPEPTHTEEPAE